MRMFLLPVRINLDPHARVAQILFAVVLIAVLTLAVGLWLLIGRGPRRRRGEQRARQLLQQGDWQAALALVQALQKRGRLSPAWQGRLRSLEGECQRVAGDTALADKRYEDSLNHSLLAAQLLNLDRGEARTRLLEAMLAEVRRLFATGTGIKETEALHKLLARVLALQSSCPEASFWQGLCYVRDGRMELALNALRAAHEGADKRFLDPPLYLGAVLLREGKPQEALRHLSEANRLDANCAFVSWQLGAAIVAAGGDSGLAVRALQRAVNRLSPFRGKEAAYQQAWVAMTPEGRSFVRRLALKHPYPCPLFGGDLAVVIRQVQFTLAQAHYRLGNFAAAADLYATVLQESPPSVPLLRGLGLALVRLERYDEAFKHLRIAYEQEEPKSHVTAGYLALCGALGKAKQSDDKPRNILWAIRLLAKFDRPGDTEWASLCSNVFAEARALDLTIAVEDQVRLCDLLASVHAIDPRAAAAYDHLAGTSPESIRPAHVWLYCRAAQEHQFAGVHDLTLFGRLFQEEAAARAYYAERQWSFDEVEYTYLERYATQQSGSFPRELGADYPARGESLLLDRSKRLQESGNLDVALVTADVHYRLAPHSTRALDRLANLYYQRGMLDRSAELLASWSQLDPGNHWPLVRRAVVEQQRGQATACAEAVEQALRLSRGATRAAIAFLGGRLLLALQQTSEVLKTSEVYERAQHFLQQCLTEDPDHLDALAHLAAVRSLLGDRQGLAAQAAAMHRPGVTDPRFQYAAAACHLAAGDYRLLLEAARRASADRALVNECHYLIGWAYYHLGDTPAAVTALQKVAGDANSASVDHARALLGCIAFQANDYEAAIQWWGDLDVWKRTAWQLDETLRATIYLSGLHAYAANQYEQAADCFRTAKQLGLQESKLDALLTLALVKAGQALLFELEPMAEEATVMDAAAEDDADESDSVQGTYNVLP